MTLADDADTSFGRALALTNRARVALGLGQVDEAVIAARSALEVADASGTPWLAHAPAQILAEASGALTGDDGR